MTEEKTVFNYTYTGEDGLRLDQFVTNQLTDESRTTIKKWIKDKLVTVNGKVAKASQSLVNGDLIGVEKPAPAEAEEFKPVAEKMALDIVFEDDDILVVNKPANLVVHPSVNHPTNTLVNGLLYHVQENGSQLAVGRESFRPGIVHRLDKDTTGLLVVAKSQAALENLTKQVANHQMTRIYAGLVYGEIFEAGGTIDAPIRRHEKDRLKFETNEAGRHAVTHFTVKHRYVGYTLVNFQLETGRTHQIRVHANFINHPIVDDPLYARQYKERFFSDNGQLLHAHRLELEHPVTGEHMVFDAPIPDHFQEVLHQLTFKGV
ncbi:MULTISPECIES: RluA family pseudouridine synthase [unclassified Aerococcus]|uniref:RluA family pseudouridine synthase n=1 Tax=unclassified Aerococcus TaxID=2618060 RepID=UPI000DA05060|nr:MULTISPECIES: RluA family pseudouridine synthase [unclassified Aerococcus]SPT61788.1 Ribosomal large subunit pseudouridine synthase D [Aerococcus viridans]